MAMFWAIIFLASVAGALLLFIAFGIASKKTPDLLSGHARGDMAKAPDPVAAEAKAAENSSVKMEAEAQEATAGSWPKDEPLPEVTGKFASEADLDEAELMLREVKAMLLLGRPDRAIAHIRSSTGVDEQLAAEFVEEVQQGLLG
jgi:hypothetical protein